MGQLYDLKIKIYEAITAKKLDIYEVGGRIVLAAGILLSSLKPETPDDPERIEKLKKAAAEILGIKV